MKIYLLRKIGTEEYMGYAGYQELQYAYVYPEPRFPVLEDEAEWVEFESTGFFDKKWVFDPDME